MTIETDLSGTGQPEFSKALGYFASLLKDAGFPGERIWVRSGRAILAPSSRGATVFLRDPGKTSEDDIRHMYENYESSRGFKIFYVVGIFDGRTVCALLADIFPDDPDDAVDLISTSTSEPGFLVYRDDWSLMFCGNESSNVFEVVESRFKWCLLLLRQYLSQTFLSNLDYMYK